MSMSERETTSDARRRRIKTGQVDQIRVRVCLRDRARAQNHRHRAASCDEVASERGLAVHPRVSIWPSTGQTAPAVRARRSEGHSQCSPAHQPRSPGSNSVISSLRTDRSAPMSARRRSATERKRATAPCTSTPSRVVECIEMGA
jgi:hypothetical protein